MGRQQLVTERLDARRMSELETEDLQPILPLREVGLLRIASRRIAWKARRHDDVRAAAQQLEACLVADLDASAREQRHASSQFGQLRSLAVVQFRAPGTELVVEVMNLGVLLFAHVTVLQLGCAKRS